MAHPIVAQIGPSPDQAPAVLRRGCDIVVTAGAGTGKTLTLVARYLSLLADGMPLRSIVAITFTRKAAREMRNRIRDEVRCYLDEGDLAPDERDLWQERYTAIDAARIGTIHSLCAEILRSHPAEAGVDPHFRVLEEGHAGIFRGRAVEHALAWAADDEDAVRLFELLGERGLRDTVASLLHNRLETETALAASSDTVGAVWPPRVLRQIEVFVDEPGVRDSFRELLQLRADGAIARAEIAGDLLAEPLTQLLACWDVLSVARDHGDWATVSSHLAPLRARMKLGGRAANWAPANPKGAIRYLRDAYDHTMEPWVDGGISLDLDRRVAESTPALHRLVLRAVTGYRAMLEQLQALDYDDLEDRALGLLRRDAVVRERWRGDVTAVLVDEFQDTNGRQRDLIAQLNGDGGKLFIVGDAKQSIYRFRGADVTVFRGERESISRRGAAYRLETSYRAHREMVRALNSLLRPILGEEEDPGRPWAEPFAPLRHAREEPAPGLHAPFVELHLTVGSKSGGALSRAADALAARICALRKVGVGFDEVAILCRASTSFPFYEDAMERAAIPYLTFAGRGFYDRPEVRDLLNALRALQDPTDDLALAGLLRSPALAVSDEGLFRLCQARGRSPTAAALWDVLQASWHELDDPVGARAGRALEVITAIREHVGRSPVADVLKAFLDLTDYRAVMLGAGEARGRRNVSKLLADAHASGSVSIGEFLEFVDGLRASGAREGEARATAEGAVQIMTVHAAKGLEYPVVVIGDASYGGRGGDGPLIDPDLGVLLPIRDDQGNMSAAFRLGKAIERDKEAAEADRLLYVAATRAREKLLLSGCISIKKNGSLGSLGGWLGEIAEAVGLKGASLDYDDEGSALREVDLQVDSVPVSCTIYEPNVPWPSCTSAQVRASSSQVQLPPPLIRTVDRSAMAVDARTREEERDPPNRVWRVVPAVSRPRAPAWVVGALVHAALASWRFPDEGFEQWVLARARGYGLADARQLSGAVKETGQLLGRFRRHALAAEMDASMRRLHEVPYSVAADGEAERGIIDAMYFSEGKWTIVEFKTDDVRDDAQLRKLLDSDDYVPQAQRYRAAVEQLLGERPRLLLCLLNFAGTVRIEQL